MMKTGNGLKEKVEDEESDLAFYAVQISKQQKLRDYRQASWLWSAPELLWRIL